MSFVWVGWSLQRDGFDRRGQLLCHFLAAWLMLGAAAPLWAQLPHARLDGIYPPGGQRGTTVEVAIGGADLDDARSLQFSHPGMTAAAKLVPPRSFEQQPQPAPGQFMVSIADEVPPGTYECRVLGRYGLSTPLAFAVGSLPEVLEQGNNNSLDSPMPLEIDSLVNGRSGGDKFDIYQFTAMAGQRVLIQCQTLRVDSQMDASLVLLDASGNRLATSRNALRSEPLIDFTAPADGEYRVQVYDATYRGGESFVYRLSVSTHPHLDFVFPPAGMPGTTGKFTLYGRNLPDAQPAAGVTIDGMPLEQREVEITIPTDTPGPAVPLVSKLVAPIDAEARGFEYRLDTADATSNAVFIAFATATAVPEQEMNDDREQPQRVPVPCEVVGQFYPRRDQDWFAFDAQAGESFAIEVFSQRWGLPTDPALLVQHVQTNEQGEQQVRDIQESDDLEEKFDNPPFDGFRRDPAVVFTADVEGTYRVLVRDLYAGSSPDPRHVYSMSIGPPRPDFRLLATFKDFAVADPDQTLPGAPILRQGGTAPAVVQVFRRSGFKGPVTVSASGLPPGVTCRPVVVAPDRNRVTLVFSAAENTTAWSGPIEIIGTAEVDDQEVHRQALSSSIMGNPSNPKEPGHARLTSDVMLSVIAEPMPLAVKIAGEGPWETSLAGKLSIPVQVSRREDVKGALKLDARDLPAEIKAATLNIDGQTQEAQLELTIDPKAPTGSLSFYLAGQSKVAYQRNPEAAQAAEEKKLAFADLILRLTEQSQAAKASKAKATKQAAELAAAVTATDSSADRDSAEEAKMQATQAVQKLEETLKAAKEEQKLVEKRAAELTAAAQSKDIDVFIHSLPLTLQIDEAPITVTTIDPTVAIAQGGEGNIAVRIERRYGFADAVDVQVTLPQEIQGIAIDKMRIPADQAAGKLIVKVAANATTGTHPIKLSAVLQYNGQKLQVDQPLEIKIESSEPESPTEA